MTDSKHDCYMFLINTKKYKTRVDPVADSFILDNVTKNITFKSLNDLTSVM